MPELSLSLPQARALMLAAQGLLTPPARPAVKADILTAIRKIHNLQLDTISVVARAHLHILWSRLGAFHPRWLDELHAEGALFEFWAHAACLLPIEDYPLYRSLMREKFIGWENIRAWGEAHPEIVSEMLAHLRENGAVKSSDFAREGPRGKWWDWKVEKVALEYLYYKGYVMVACRQGFQRVYDLRERVLPGWDDARIPPYPDALRQLVLMSVKALGIARENWVAPYFYLPKRLVPAILAELQAAGELLPVRVSGLEGKPVYMHPQNLELLEQTCAGTLQANMTTILSPFDPLVSDRLRTQQLFGFDYQLECYLLASKRKYGYFSLPLLHNGSLVGRMDAKAHRKEKRLEVVKLFLEEGVRPEDALLVDLAKTLRAYASWQGLSEVRVTSAEPAQASAALNALLRD